MLTTDASAFAIGAVLSQGPIGKDLPIAFASRTLCSAETKYSTIERELLAIVWAVKHFRPYLFGRKFTLITDHRPLTWLFSIKDPGSRLARWRLKLEEYTYKIEHKPGKINKNADALSRIKINHFQECAKFQAKIRLHASNEINEPGTSKQGNNLENDEGKIEEEENPPATDDYEETEEYMVQEYNKFTKMYKTTSLIDYSKVEISNSQLLDKNHKNIIGFFWQNKLQELHHQIMDDILEEEFDFSSSNVNIVHSKSVKNRRYFIIPLPFDFETVVPHLFYILYRDRHEFDETQVYCIENNLELPILELFSFIFADKAIKIRICQDLVRTPESDEIPQILDHYHRGKTNLHRGINETVRRIKEKYTWPNLTKDVERFLKSCETCQKTKICRQNLSGPLVITETPKTPFERINIDVFEYPTRNHALTIRDELTKFTQAYPLADKTAKTIANTLLVFFQHYGAPLRIHCDYGPEFNNMIIKDLCRLFNIKLTFSSVSHPQSNGSLERFHATLSEMIRANHSENPGEHPFQVLPYAIICYNNTRNKTHGFTPYELIFGHTSSRPPETLYNQEELISKYVRDLNNRMNFYYKQARQRTELKKEKAKARHDEHTNTRIYDYKVGDKVYVKESQIKTKAENLFNGPFEILEIYQNSAKLLNPKTNQHSKINFDRLKPYAESPFSDSAACSQ